MNNNIDMIPVESSNLESVGYDEINKQLYVRFLKGGLYFYSNVPVTIYSALMNASSHGEYFSRYIRNDYPTQRVE